MSVVNQTRQVGLVQQRVLSHKDDNLQQTAQMVAQAKAQGAELVVLQELHATPYFCQTEDPCYFDLAESVPGASSRFLGQLAQQHAVVLVGSLFERRASGLYHNTAVIFDTDGQLKGCYRKAHIPHDPGYYEKYYFAPGDSLMRPIKTSLGQLGVLVCWDQWFPEAARCMALSGADLLIYPTAIGWDSTASQTENERQFAAWQTVQQGHAIANVLPVLTCNRVGLEEDPSGRTDGQRFWGGSFVCDQQGQILAQAATDKSQLLNVTIDLAQTDQLRRQWPFLRDRRVDAYGALMRQWCDDELSQ